MDVWGLVGIVLGILTIILFIIRKFSIIVTALAGFMASNFAILLLGSILAKYMDTSGATVSIANKVLSIAGTKNPYNALVAIFIISAMLTYGGVNVLVIIFALIPMAKPIFRE